MNSADFVKRFIDELGDVKDWYHNGVVNELPFACGLCVCGHQIKFEYYIVNRKTNEKRTLGSECIEHFKDYNIELYESLISSKKSFKEKKKAEKLAPIVEEYESLKKEYSDLKKAVDEYKIQKGRIERDLFMFSITNDRSSGYKTIKGKKNHIESLVEQGRHAVKENNLDVKKYLIDANKRSEIFKRIETEREKNPDFTRIINQEVSSLNPSLEEYYSFFEKYDNEVIEKKDYYRIEIHGKSYPIKDSLKQQGFHWNGECWALYTYDETFKPVIEENAKVKVVRIKMDY